jgi:hypothetical protein
MPRVPVPARATLIAVACSLLPAADAGAEGEPLPAGVVAQVAQEQILEGDFDHWLRTSLRGSGPPRLDPPRFRRCIAAERRRSAKRARTLTGRAARARCERRYRALRRGVVQFLVQGAWLRQEAAARGIVVTRVQARRALAREKRAAFGGERARSSRRHRP